MIHQEPLNSLQQQRIGDLHTSQIIGGNLATQVGITSVNAYWAEPIGTRYNALVASDPESARAYLKSALDDLRVSMKIASERVGKNHAYLQQYIKGGKPLWLPETVRDGLVRAYSLDGERLRPPPASLRPSRPVADRHDERQIDIPRLSKFVDDPRKLELLDIYDAIAPEIRPLALVILRNLAAYSVPNLA